MTTTTQSKRAAALAKARSKCGLPPVQQVKAPAPRPPQALDGILRIGDRIIWLNDDGDGGFPATVESLLIYGQRVSHAAWAQCTDQSVTVVMTNGHRALGCDVRPVGGAQ